MFKKQARCDVCDKSFSIDEWCLPWNAAAIVTGKICVNCQSVIGVKRRLDRTQQEADIVLESMKSKQELAQNNDSPMTPLLPHPISFTDALQNQKFKNLMTYPERSTDQLTSSASYNHNDPPSENNCIGGVKVYSVDKNGGEFYMSEHGVLIVIPKMAVPTGVTAEMKFAATMIAPVYFFDKTTPVSPIIWLCMDVALQKPIHLRIPHFVNVESRCHSNVLQFAKASIHSLSSTERRIMNAIKGGNFPVGESYGTIEIKHFCYYCIQVLDVDDIPENLYQVITLKELQPNVNSKLWNIHVCITPQLGTCLKSNVDFKQAYVDNNSKKRLIIEIEQKKYPPRFEFEVSESCHHRGYFDHLRYLRYEIIGGKVGDKEKISAKLSVPPYADQLQPQPHQLRITSQPQQRVLENEKLRQKPTHQMISRVCSLLVAKWRIIGFELLHNKPEVVKNIESTTKSNDEKCLDMLITWLETDSYASYSKLIDALYQCGLDNAAEKVKNKILMSH